MAILIELPNGKTLLYDAGSLQNGTFAGRTVQNALWNRGLSRIDTMVISHADVDHFNGVPQLLKTIPIGSLLVAPQFLDLDQKAVEVVYQTASAENIPFVEIGRENRLLLDRTVIIEVLHPEKHSPKSDGHADDDNANSVVLLIEYAGRRILLTGDLEEQGLDELLNHQPPRKIDVMLSPHHGSPDSNTTQLARWARPDFVTVSAGKSRRLEALQATYGSDTKLFSTALHGAVTFRIEPGGNLHYSHSLHPGEWIPASK
ncbi:MAG: MBL fold metallo-hydrolase [Planctomycetes bacterium]|nr:MBL fold metallo-hydrolase [Planctomycetota bacterium]